MGNNSRTSRVKKVATDIIQISLPTPFPVGDVNVYLIEGKGLTLVDTGPKSNEAWDILCESIEACGYSLTDVHQIVLTHDHPDHCGLLEKMRKVSGAKTLAHPLVVPLLEETNKHLENYLEFWATMYQENGVPKEVELRANTLLRGIYEKWFEPSEINIILEHKQKLPNFEEWEVLYTPGHAQGHISLLRRSDGVMIGGDHIIAHISSNPAIEPPNSQSKGRPLPLLQCHASLLQLSNDENINIVFSGHGEPVTNVQKFVQNRLEMDFQRMEEIRNYLVDEEKTIYELINLMFPNSSSKDLNFTFSEISGHLDFLQLLYHIKCQTIEGIKYYSAMY